MWRNLLGYDLCAHIATLPVGTVPISVTDIDFKAPIFVVDVTKDHITM